MKIPCSVIQDLIPLVQDGVASQESTDLVIEHIQTCSECKREFENLGGTVPDTFTIQDEKIIEKIKRSFYYTQAIILLAGAVIGIALTNSFGMFYNLIIMPLIGGVSYFAYKKRCFLAPVIVFVLTYLYQIFESIWSGIFEWEYLYFSLVFSTIYASLVLIGIVIAFLLKFAFGKDEES